MYAGLFPLEFPTRIVSYLAFSVRATCPGRCIVPYFVKRTSYDVLCRVCKVLETNVLRIVCATCLPKKMIRLAACSNFPQKITVVKFLPM